MSDLQKEEMKCTQKNKKREKGAMLKKEVRKER
jgi:hypothetical protein